MTECYFTPKENTTSATICANCGLEKSLHTIGEGVRAINYELNFKTMIKAQFIDLGRNNVNKIVTVKNERELHKEIGKHILSKGWGMEETKDPDIWAITSGWNTVGTVKILDQ